MDSTHENTYPPQISTASFTTNFRASPWTMTLPDYETIERLQLTADTLASTDYLAINAMSNGESMSRARLRLMSSLIPAKGKAPPTANTPSSNPSTSSLSNLGSNRRQSSS